MGYMLLPVLRELLSYFMLTWLPFYLVRERHFSMQHMAQIGGGIFLSSRVSASICGWLRDRWIVAGETPTRVRKSFVVFRAAAMGLFLALSVVTARSLSLIFLMLAGLAFGLSSSNLWVITQRIAGPEAAGRSTGIQNFIGNLAGTVVSAVTGYLLGWTGRFLWIPDRFDIPVDECFIVDLHRGPVEPVQRGAGLVFQALRPTRPEFTAANGTSVTTRAPGFSHCVLDNIRSRPIFSFSFLRHSA